MTDAESENAILHAEHVYQASWRQPEDVDPGDQQSCTIDDCDKRRHSGWTLCLRHGRQQIERWNR
jgi:hypothetical protein